jgi:hypothetical protein
MFKIYLSTVTKVYNDGLTQIEPRVIHFEVKLTFETLMLKHPILSASRHACSTVGTIGGTGMRGAPADAMLIEALPCREGLLLARQCIVSPKIYVETDYMGMVKLWE